MHVFVFAASALKEWFDGTFWVRCSFCGRHVAVSGVARVPGVDDLAGRVATDDWDRFTTAR